MRLTLFLFTILTANAAICTPVARKDANLATTAHPTVEKQKQLPFGMPGFGGLGVMPAFGGMGMPGVGGMPLGGLAGGAGSPEWMYGLGYANGVQGANAAAQGK